ncbi:MAG: membrane fusion protein (multidrug efflux system) [Roseivirga sp.]|jgi:membrane fusion protein (multidrug efflux system)
MTTKKLKHTQQMKAKSIATIFIAMLTIAACGPKTETLDAKKENLTTARQDLKEIRDQIILLEEEIAKEDPTYFNTEAAATLVTTVKVANENFEHRIEVRGSVMSRTNVNVSAESMGQLKTVNVVEGQNVKKGQILATVDSEQIENSIVEVKTALVYATTIYEKRERLWKQNIGTEVDYLTAKNNKESLENQLVSLNTQLSKTKIVAPFSGSIENVPVKAGQVVQMGTPIAFLVSNTDKYVSAEVSEAYLGKVAEGDIVHVKMPSLGKSFESKVISIGNVINQASRTFSIEVKLPAVEDIMKVNLVTVVEITDYQAPEAVVIPSRIIQEDLEGNYVYTVGADSKALKVHVKLGPSFENHTQVISGLQAGVSVVDKGNRSIADGTRVKIQN